MGYNPNIPAPTDLLSISQAQIRNNFAQSNETYGGDHYAFSDLTTNKSKHNRIRTPIINPVGHPTTLSDEPAFYAMQDTANLGVLQYSRGGNDAAPTPVTYLQSPLAGIPMIAGSTINILDFTGITMAYGYLFAMDSNSAPPNIPICYATIFFNTLGFSIVPVAFRFSVSSTGNILELTNSSGTNFSSVFWTLVLYRINT